jgi:phosphohistidine phosphatase
VKRLSVLRHAKSSWEEPNLDDFDRPLNERGRTAARRIGRELKQRKIGFDLCLASPAGRVRETLDGVAQGYGDFRFEVRFEPRIYAATTEALLDLIRGISEEVESPLIVGHNPGLHELLLRLTSSGDLRRRVEAKLPTAAFATIELPAKRWADVMAGTGKIVELILPKEID